jgi:hypothetical protein
MPKVEIMPFKEKLSLNVKAIQLEEQGKLEEAEKIRQQIPMPPYLAKFAKEHLGPEFLIKYSWNLSEADAEYGSGWLNK